MKPYWEGDGITLYHGDCREIDAWLAADVLVTDPPYGIAWEQKTGAAPKLSRQSVKAQTRTRNAIRADCDTDARDQALAMWDTRPAVVFGSWRMPRPDNTKHRLIWHKKAAHPGLRATATTAWFSADEEVYILGDGFIGPPEQNIIVTTENRHGAAGAAALVGHPTPKPLPLMEALLRHCPPGTIADPFAGSGSTLVAARNQGRKAIGVELEEKYCEIAARRLDQGVMEFPA